VAFLALDGGEKEWGCLQAKEDEGLSQGEAIVNHIFLTGLQTARHGCVCVSSVSAEVPCSFKNGHLDREASTFSFLLEDPALLAGVGSDPSQSPSPPLEGCVTMSENAILVILNEVKNLMKSKTLPLEILRLTPQNDIKKQPLKGEGNVAYVKLCC
jgi:hypothetical protein